MVVIPAQGKSFQMGSPDTEPGHAFHETQHGVTFAKSFAVGETPITVAQWMAFVTEKPYADSYSGDDDCKAAAPDDDSPVVCVSWDDAQVYITWLSDKTGETYRLLTESEWEYVARAGTTTAYPFPGITVDASGDPTSNELAKHANYHDLYDYANAGADLGVRGTLDGYVYTSPVGHYKVNAFGVSDMIGNVLEWTQDCYVDDYMDANVPKDGTANTSVGCGSRVFRGGSWVDDPQYLRSAYRHAIVPTFLNDSIGFRVARTVP
jgi:formylglycine-generating enzyme required for sulfatase activity